MREKHWRVWHQISRTLVKIFDENQLVLGSSGEESVIIFKVRSVVPLYRNIEKVKILHIVWTIWPTRIEHWKLLVYWNVTHKIIVNWISRKKSFSAKNSAIKCKFDQRKDSWYCCGICSVLERVIPNLFFFSFWSNTTTLCDWNGGKRRYLRWQRIFCWRKNQREFDIFMLKPRATHFGQTERKKWKYKDNKE